MAAAGVMAALAVCLQVVEATEAPPLAPHDFLLPRRQLSAAANPQTKALGPLASLAGRWAGHGQNLVSLPDRRSMSQSVLVLQQAFTEELEFRDMPEVVLNRGFMPDGSGQSDQRLHGLAYTDNVVLDSVLYADPPDSRFSNKSGSSVHSENGQWLFKVTPEAEAQPWTIMRMGSIPHGTAIMAFGGFNVSDTFNATHELDMLSSQYDFPPGEHLGCGCFGRGECVQPTEFLRSQLEGLTVASFKKFQYSTQASSKGGGVVNTPFVNREVQAGDFRATFYLLEVAAGRTGPRREMLLYAQTVMFTFEGVCQGGALSQIQWPHTIVGALARPP